MKILHAIFALTVIFVFSVICSARGETLKVIEKGEKRQVFIREGFIVPRN